MNENQTPSQTPTPDYDFIMNQSPPQGAPENEKKPHSKKFIILIVLLILLIIVAAVAIFVDKRPKSTQGEQPKATTSQGAANGFITALSDGNDTDLARASAYVDTSDRSSELVVASLQRLKDLIDFSTCTPASVSIADTQEAYKCTEKSGKDVIVTVDTKPADDRVLVSAYRISNVEPN